MRERTPAQVCAHVVMYQPALRGALGGLQRIQEALPLHHRQLRLVLQVLDGVQQRLPVGGLLQLRDLPLHLAGKAGARSVGGWGMLVGERGRGPAPPALGSGDSVPQVPAQVASLSTRVCACDCVYGCRPDDENLFFAIRNGVLERLFFILIVVS